MSGYLVEQAMIEWAHPTIGRITEIACREHEAQILQALRTLGIGCSRTSISGLGRCFRCDHPDIEPRRMLRGDVP